jgi:hypothetical protein
VFVIDSSLDNTIRIVKEKISKEIFKETSKLLLLSRKMWKENENGLFVGRFKSHCDDNQLISNEWDLSSTSSHWKDGVVLHVVEKDDPFSYEVTIASGYERKNI